MPTPRSVAEDERYHLIVTLWPSPEHRRLGGDALRAATGVMRDGSTIGIVHPDGSTLLYPPGLDPALTVSMMLSTAAQSVQVSIEWDRDLSVPGDLDMRNAVAELALIDEVSGGASVTPWQFRRVVLSGHVKNLTWGTGADPITFTLASEDIRDAGDLHPPGAELTVERFADIGSSLDRDRAPNADGLLPPLVWAPVGSNLRVPLAVVVDEDDAVSGVSSIVPRRWLLGYWRPTNTTAVEQLVAVDPDDDLKTLWSETDAVGQRVPQSATDLLGETYWYFLGDFAVPFGNASVSFTAGSPLATATRTGDMIRRGWQARGSTGGADDYLVVLSADGDQFELGDSAGTPVNYGGPNLVNGTGVSIPIPPDRADGVYWIPKLGGIGGASGPVSHAIDVLQAWLRSSQIGRPIAYGDLDALRSRMGDIHVSFVSRERTSPHAKALDLLRFLPIRPYLSGGILRFRWVGRVQEEEIVATIDLDDLGGAYRLEPVSWLDEETFPAVRLSSWWDIPTQRYRQTLMVDGTRRDYSDASRVPCGRALRAFGVWRDAQEASTPGRMPVLNVGADTLETAHGEEAAVLNLLYRWSLPRQPMELDIDGAWRWLEPGDAIRVVETERVSVSHVFRVEGMSLNGAGSGKLLLETINE